ncbi:aminotransferase class I/II-fold pyridoxal phosphate-dependent enzyme [Streptomyces daqingensis]|uniref:aminotransferase class I/II-fold pyridoxal phosphate-dependent enzyme n=1 Tax=Streptomyces daqingensis TaxID=1472640 RepID=UPI001668475C|nr:aminotransferase class I/II-fold pyridoxal phosphate-dependent enzyme [Streptomyces daqingensis]
MLEGYRIEGRRAAEISASVENGVRSGGLAPGDALPPVRDLAADLGVNANTVASAYRALRERGVIETAGRRGSRIRERRAETAPREAIRVEVPEGGRDIASGNPDPRLLPPLHTALAAAAEAVSHRSTFYGGPSVDARLARTARALLDADGVPDGPLALTSGALDAIGLALSEQLHPGDAVAVEDPGWGSVLDLVPALGMRPVPVAVDDEGPRPEDVERALGEGASALVVTSRAQNPTGAAVSAERSRRLREVLASHPQTLLVEDDHGHGIVDAPLRPVVGTTDRWVLVRSTAKAYGPDLRLAVVTGDALTLDRMQRRQLLGPGWVSHLLQAAVRHLWETDALDVRSVARAYGERREALVRALAARGVAARGRTGMNVWVPVTDETGAVARLLQSGWGVAPGARFRVNSAPGVRLTVSELVMDDIEELAGAVAAALRPGEARRYE